MGLFSNKEEPKNNDFLEEIEQSLIEKDGNEHAIVFKSLSNFYAVGKTKPSVDKEYTNLLNGILELLSKHNLELIDVKFNTSSNGEPSSHVEHQNIIIYK